MRGAGRRRRRRDRARRPGPRLVRARRRRAGLARAAAAPARRARAARPRRASACSTSTRARCATRWSPTMLELPTVVPYFDLSLQHARRAPAAPHEAVGERRPLPRPSSTRIRASEPDGRVPVVVHRRLPRRDRDASTTSCSRSSRRPSSTGPGSSRSRPRTARPRPTLDRPVPAELVARAAARVRARCRTRSPSAARDALVGRRGRGARRRRRRRIGHARRPHPPRGAGDRRRRPVCGADCARPGAPVTRASSPRPKARTSIGAAPTAPSAADRSDRDRPVTRNACGQAVRTGRGRDAGELRHDRPAAPRGPDAAPHRRRGLDAGSPSSLWFVLAVHRRPRRLARPPRRHHPFGRVPRSAGRQVPGASAASSRSVIRGDFSWCRGRSSSRCARSASPCTGRSPAGAASRCPARRLGKWKAFFQFLAVGVVLLPAHVRVGDVPRRRPLDRGRAHGRLGPRHRAPAAGAADPARLPMRLTSSRSAPSCCSARSSTRTARGSASSSRRSGIDTLRAPQGRRQPRPHGRSACASCSTRADAVIVCGGLGPTPDDVTREAIAEVMGVELERREELDRAHRAHLRRPRPADMPANNLRQADVPEGRRRRSRTRSAPRPGCVRAERRRRQGRVRGARACRTR